MRYDFYSLELFLSVAATGSIAGAAAAGVDSVYVASGVHLGPGGTLDDGALTRLFAGMARPPIAAMTAFAW